jgi:glutathione synthase/RimK-type ligase-like ATP-grasp enzyme|tara:strand:+ start:1974 stop:3182 length:1209 start_codon:yes stop_codon:yes gene_type:complete
LKYLKLFEQFLNEKKPKGAPDFHHSDAPDANGRFKDLSIKDLAAWLIKTRKKDVKKISGSLTQQIVFNRKSDPKYAEKMEKTRKEVYKQLGREDLLKESIDTESGLGKVYLAFREDSGQRWWTYKGFAGNNFFTQLHENNMDDIDINPDYPVLTYHTDTVNKLLKAGKIKKENIYNHPDHISKSGSKEEFHKLVGEDENIPKTVYSKNDALENLTFPIIAKPARGHSGEGIQIIEKPDLMEEVDEKIFDTFSEYIDKAEEHRFINFKGKPIFWMERTPINEKAKSGKGSAKEAMEFGYAKRDIKDLPKDYKKVLEKFCKIYEDLPYMCFDVMKGKNGKVYIIESNAQPGVPFDSTIEAYKHIYEDFYKKSLDEESLTKLNEYAKTMIEKTLKKDGGKRFSIK